MWVTRVLDFYHLNNFFKIKVYDLRTRTTSPLLTEANNIRLPKALAVHESRLYYLDPLYDKIERIDLPAGENPKLIMDNESELKNFVIFKKRASKFN